jgi:hypothetical protein
MPVFTKVSCGKPGYLALLVATALAAMLGKASAACDYPKLRPASRIVVPSPTLARSNMRDARQGASRHAARWRSRSRNP